MNLFERYENDEFKKVGTKKLLWNGLNQFFEVVRVNIEELKYNVLNGRIAELDLATDIDVDNAVYKDIKKSIIKNSKDNIEKLGKDIGKSKLKEPLIVNKDGIIVDGNRRYTAISMLLEGEIKPFTPSDVADLENIEVVIIDADTETVAMKNLEYSIQFDDMKRDYDPISRAFDFARSHYKLKMSIDQIAESTGISKTEIEKDIRTVQLIRVYLEAIGDRNNIALAIELKLDGPMKEMASNKSKTEYFLNNQQELVDIITTVKAQGGDVTRAVRDLIKPSVKNNSQTVINSAVVKKQVKELASEIGVGNIIKKAHKATTTNEKVSILTNANDKNKKKVASKLNNLFSELTTENKKAEIARNIDKFLTFVRTLNTKEITPSDKLKLTKIREAIEDL